ncbi:hypothetical protein PspKH34_31900 [Parageobacillus sp. KH3-4]|jgi:hypothetical protein|nr:hypothetical protein PspKH34_31900 [Parageobacillus sp. KH3-4]
MCFSADSLRVLAEYGRKAIFRFRLTRTNSFYIINLEFEIYELSVYVAFNKEMNEMRKNGQITIGKFQQICEAFGHLPKKSA